MSTWNNPLVQNPYVKYASWAITGCSALALFPGFLLRTPEFEAYFQQRPVRSLIELIGSCGLLGSVAAQMLGARCPKFVLDAMERHMPQAMNLKNLAPISLALRALVGGALMFSLSRGINPPHQKQLLDLKGKTALVTGGTSGIGLETVRALVKQGATVVLVARNLLKAVKQAALITKDFPNAKIPILVADQTDLAAIASLAEKLSQEVPNGIDIVLLNAGAAVTMPPTIGPSGYESSITSMHLAHALLMKMIWPKLNSNARVVITSSAAHAGPYTVDSIFEGLRDVSDPNSTLLKNSSQIYARAKLANAMFARALGNLADTDSRKIIVTAHHPGVVATNIWDSASPPSLALFLSIIAPVTLRTIPQGAATLIDAVLGAKPMMGQEQAPNGAYYTSSRLLTHGPFYLPLLDDPTQVKRMWDLTEELIKPFEPASASWKAQ